MTLTLTKMVPFQTQIYATCFHITLANKTSSNIKTAIRTDATDAPQNTQISGVFPFLCRLLGGPCWSPAGLLSI